MKEHELRERDRGNALLSPLLRALETRHGEAGIQTVTEYYFEEALGISQGHDDPNGHCKRCGLITDLANFRLD